MCEQLKWWEKTVEYLYVHKHFTENDFIAPLDGNEEAAGDAMSGNKDKFILIEFKKDISSLDSEEEKFDGGNYDAAKNKLEDKDAHHFLVYGEQENEKLHLVSQTYFSKTHADVSELLEHGVELDAFNRYLKEFISYKNNKNSSGGGMNTLVAGISTDGTSKKTCASLEAFRLEHDPEFSPPNLTPEASVRSMEI